MNETQQPRSIVERIYGWLSTGYPEGVPPQDRFAVGALLSNRLNETELTTIVRRMAHSKHVDEWLNGNPPTEDDIARYIRKVIDGFPTADDIQRVSARLAAAGWPLAGFPIGDGEDEVTEHHRRRHHSSASAADAAPQDNSAPEDSTASHDNSAQ